MEYAFLRGFIQRANRYLGGRTRFFNVARFDRRARFPDKAARTPAIHAVSQASLLILPDTFLC